MTSQSVIIRNAAADLIATVPLFGGRVKTTSFLPVSDEELPCARVTTVSRSMTADGSATTAEPQFVSSMRLGISGLINADTLDELDTDLTQTTEDMLDALLCNAAFVLLFEGVTQIECSYHLVNQAAPSGNSELLMAEARIIMSIQLREYFPPEISDDLATVALGSDQPGATADQNFGATLTLPT